MNFSEQCFRIFEQATEAYHVTDNVDATVHNPYAVTVSYTHLRAHET